VREWNFAAERDAQGWQFIDGAGATTAASEKPLLFTPGGAVLVGVEIDPQFHMPNLGIQAGETRVLVVELEVKKLGVRDPDARLGIYWHGEPQPAFRPSRALSAPLSLGPGMQTIVVDLQDSPEWRGTIRGLRLDPTDNAPIEATIRRVAFH
jgi:hypothetical protein